jgi:hypothetical protein
MCTITWYRTTQGCRTFLKAFFDELSKNFFPQIFNLVLLDGFLDGFWKFRLFIVKICILIWYFWVFFENYSMRMLSIRGTDFIAHWAYEERISAHAQPAVKCQQFLHVSNIEYLCWIEDDFQKSRVTGPWDHMVSVSAKKVKKIISCLCTFKSPILYFWEMSGFEPRELP